MGSRESSRRRRKQSRGVHMDMFSREILLMFCREELIRSNTVLKAGRIKIIRKRLF